MEWVLYIWLSVAHYSTSQNITAIPGFVTQQDCINAGTVITEKARYKQDTAYPTPFAFTRIERKKERK